MATINLKGIRSLGVGQIFEEPAEPERERLCEFNDGEDRIVAESNTFTIVLNRDLCKSVEISCAMALFLAKKYPEQNVVLVNTYAGTALMQRALASGMWRTASKGQKLPMSFKKYVPPGWDHDFAEGAPAPYPHNLRILDCPTSTFTAWRLNEELQRQPAEVVLVNSFEFAAIDSRTRRRLAAELLDLRTKRSLSVIIFSHEMKSAAAPWTPASGPIGLLTAFAGSVWRILPPHERAKWEKHTQTGIVHEQKISLHTEGTNSIEKYKDPYAEAEEAGESFFSGKNVDVWDENAEK
jgi:hypothetical protein